MANKALIMSKVRQILKLYSKGIGKKKIASQLAVSKNTVKHYIDFYLSQKIPYQEIERYGDLELNNFFHPAQAKQHPEKLQRLYESFPDVEKQLRKRGMTLALQFKEYEKKYPDGFKTTQFYHYYHLWSKKVHPSMVIQHVAGDKMYVDYAGGKLSYVDESTGELRLGEVFVAILGWSQYAYVEVVPSQNLEDFIAACENALHYFKGVPLGIVPDNLKSAVFKASKYEPQLNENFAAFAAHYNTTVLPARARKPQDKAHVENMVKIAYQRIYTSLPEKWIPTLIQLNEQVLQRLNDLNDSTLTGKECSRTDQWILELPSLQRLPEKRYEMRKVKLATVMKNGHVYLTEDKHYYSVPYELIGKKLSLQYSRSQVDLYYNYQLIASHRRIRSPHGYSTEPAHMPPQHQYVTEWSPEFFINRAKAIDPLVEHYIKEVLSRKQHPQQAYQSCRGILSFEKRVGSKRLIKACKRGHEFGYYNYKIIEEILKKNLDQFDEDPIDKSMPQHENIRGANYYQ
jgi:transposase